MDEEYTKAVGQVFIDLFREGLIYRGRRMVNWCPVSLTALSDEEVIMTEQKSKLYTVLYKLEDGSGALHVATTRPETIMADVAVAVNPKDPRYAHLIGKNVMRPLNAAPIPIIGDEYVEIEFGTGALKITPAHDKADFEIGRKFNLEIIDILTPDGHINCTEVPELHGMDRFDARGNPWKCWKPRASWSKLKTMTTRWASPNAPTSRSNRASPCNGSSNTRA